MQVQELHQPASFLPAGYNVGVQVERDWLLKCRYKD